MRLTVIGCSGSVPGPDSPASCYLLEAAGAERTWRIALDMGSGALGALQRHADPAGLDAVVLSHLHPDHCLDLCALHVWLRHGPGAGDRAPLPVLGPAATAERLDAAYRPAPGAAGVDALAVAELADGARVHVGPFEITAYAARHTAEAYALRVEAAGRVLAYSGDTDSCPGLLAAAQDADVLLAEASFVEGRDTARGVHLTGRRAGEAAAGAGARRLLLTHVPPWTDPAVVLAEAQGVYAGPVELVTAGAGYDV